MRKIEKIRKSIKSGGNAADRRRSLRAAKRIAQDMESEYIAAGECGPGCYSCYGTGRVVKPHGRICGCVRKPRPYRSGKVGPFKIVGRSAAKRQIGRAMRVEITWSAKYWPTWWPGKLGKPNGYRERGVIPIRKDLYDSLPAEVRDNIEIVF